MRRPSRRAGMMSGTTANASLNLFRDSYWISRITGGSPHRMASISSHLQASQKSVKEGAKACGALLGARTSEKIAVVEATTAGLLSAALVSIQGAVCGVPTMFVNHVNQCYSYASGASAYYIGGASIYSARYIDPMLSLTPYSLMCSSKLLSHSSHQLFAPSPCPNII